MASAQRTKSAMSSLIAPVFRRPRLIIIKVPPHSFSALQRRSDREGRSLSNLAAYLCIRPWLPPDGGIPVGSTSRRLEVSIQG